MWNDAGEAGGPLDAFVNTQRPPWQTSIRINREKGSESDRRRRAAYAGEPIQWTPRPLPRRRRARGSPSRAAQAGSRALSPPLFFPLTLPSTARLTPSPAVALPVYTDAGLLLSLADLFSVIGFVILAPVLFLILLGRGRSGRRAGVAP